jgi:hypothetical protein
LDRQIVNATFVGAGNKRAAYEAARIQARGARRSQAAERLSANTKVAGTRAELRAAQEP